MTAPIEPKVQAAGVTAALSGAALYLLQHYAFKSGVPDGVASMVYVFVPGVLAVAAGWLAPHQSRTPPPVPYVAAGGTGLTSVRVTPPDQPPDVMRGQQIAWAAQIPPRPAEPPATPPPASGAVQPPAGQP